MKKIILTLESLDKKINMIDAKFEEKISFRDKVFADFNAKIRNFDSKHSSAFEQVAYRLEELLVFLKEHMLMKEDIEGIIDAKFSKYTSDQFEFQDQVGKRCKNNEEENLILHHRVTLIEKHIGI